MWQVDRCCGTCPRVLSVRCGVVELDGQVLNELNQKALQPPWSFAQSSAAPGDMLVEDLVERGHLINPRTSVKHGG